MGLTHDLSVRRSHWFMNRAHAFAAAFILVAGLLLVSPSFALDNACGGRVAVAGAALEVSPSGGDDSANIQCALESATDQGIRTVRLVTGTFNVTRIAVQGFVGTLEGISKANTKILVADGTLDCPNGTGNVIGILGFVGGDVRVRQLTLETNNPCGGAGEFAAILFTQESCDVRTYFANVDRVDMVTNPGNSGQTIGVIASGSGTCIIGSKGPLGTVKVNRSTIDGFQQGISTRMGGQGQVDINFNTIRNVTTGVQVNDANQSTTITGNTISYNERVDPLDGGVGVAVFTGSSFAPRANRTVIHSNTFKQGSVGGASVAIANTNLEIRADHSVVVTGNRFELQQLANFSVGVGGIDIDGQIISGNTFVGTASIAIQLQGRVNFSSPSTGNTIVDNTFSQNALLVDIQLLGVSNSIVGFQDATTNDDGTDNFLLSKASKASSPTIYRSLSTEADGVVDLLKKITSPASMP